MKKIYSFFIGILMLMSPIHAQSYDTTQYYGKMNHIFHYLNKSLVSSGMLRDYGIEFLNLDHYTGAALHDSNYVSVAEWRLLYNSLYSSQINSNASLLALDSVNRLIDRFNYSNMAITFIGLHYNYQQFKANAVTSNLVSVSNGRLYDVSGRPSTPYETRQIFAMAPIRQAAFTGDNQFIFRPELFLSNTGKTISGIAYKKQGASVYQAVAFNTPFSIHYDSSGVYDLSIRITYSDNSVVYGHTKIVVYSNNIATRYGSPSTPVTITATKPYLGAYGKADIYIDYSTNNTSGTIKKPLIVVEGFDPGTPYGYSYNDFYMNLYFDFNNENYITLEYELDDIHEYDLIFVNWENGKDYIQRNAYALEEIIKYINLEKTTWNGVRQDNVIIGLSMGGLVGRYALRDMELNSQNHETRLFITHDSPHWGANIPVGLQMAAQNLAPWKIINVDFSPFEIKWVDMFPDVKDAIEMFSSPAARQMLIQRYLLNPVNNTAVADNSMHTTFLNELNTMGWPVNCRNLTLSNGACNGTKQFADNRTIFTLEGDRSLSYGQNVTLSFVFTLAGAAGPLGNLLLTKNNPNFNKWAMLAQWPLSYFSTKSSIGMDFKVRAVPATGTQEIYRGDIYSKKKILGIINVTNYLIKCRVNSNTGMLPLDNAPGGVYDVEYFGIDVEEIMDGLPKFFEEYVTASVTEPRFCFVPTASALDISSPATHFLKPLCDTAACIGPARVKDYFASLSNELHISYTQASADWILAQQGATTNCNKICKNSLYLNGASQLCAPGTYSINLPPGATATWSVTPPGIANITPASLDNSAIQLSRAGFENGNINLKVAIKNACNSNTVELSKTLYVGTPAVQQINPVGAVGKDLVPQSVYPFFTLPNLPPLGSGITDYQWEVIAGGQVVNNTQNSHNGHIRTDALGTGQNEKNITVRFRWKGCEWSSWVYYYGKIVRNLGTPPVSFFSVYPNPASEEITVMQRSASSQAFRISEEGVTEQQNKPVQWIRITDMLGNVQIQKDCDPSEKFSSERIRVSGLFPGQYIVYINDGETIHQVPFIVSY